MAKQTPIQSLLEIANTRVDEATRRLGELLTSQRTADEKLRLLQNYRKEYRDRYLQAAREGIGTDGMRNYSLFIGKLDEAIAQQQLMVNHQRTMTELGQQKWRDERNRMKAFDTLSQREQQQLQHRENRQEQKQSDEHAAKKYRDRDPDSDSHGN